MAKPVTQGKACFQVIHKQKPPAPYKLLEEGL